MVGGDPPRKSIEFIFDEGWLTICKLFDGHFIGGQ